VGGEIGGGVRAGWGLIAVGESRAVVDVEGGEEGVGKVAVEADVEGVALVVVECGVAGGDVAGIGG